jgi:hypothetical protein
MNEASEQRLALAKKDCDRTHLKNYQKHIVQP